MHESEEYATRCVITSRDMQSGVANMPTINRTSAFTPALGRIPTPFYDAALRIFTRERTWRDLVLDLVAGLHPGAVLDVGSGTGTLAIAMSERLPGTIVTGLDPDPEALMIAMRKAIGAGRRVQWHRGLRLTPPKAGGRTASMSSPARSSCIRCRSPTRSAGFQQCEPHCGRAAKAQRFHFCNPVLQR